MSELSVIPRDMTTGPLRVEMRFRNGRLYDAIEAAAVPFQSDARLSALQKHGPVTAFCEIYDLPRHQVYALLNLKLSPLLKHGRTDRTRIRPICQRLSDVLQIPITELFPESLYAIAWKTTQFAINIAPEMVNIEALDRIATHQYLSQGAIQHRAIEGAQTRMIVREVVGTLNPRERKVLKLRFGMGGNAEHTLDEVAAELGVSRERIRQIETKALRKLRHPTRLKRLRPLIEDRPGVAE